MRNLLRARVGKACCFLTTHLGIRFIVVLASIGLARSGILDQSVPNGLYFVLEPDFFFANMSDEIGSLKNWDPKVLWPRK